MSTHNSVDKVWMASMPSGQAVSGAQPLLPHQVLAEDFSVLVVHRRPGMLPRQVRR